MEEFVKAKVRYLSDIFVNKLKIPEYQRPYRWKAEKHVKQLLEDIENEIQKESEEYRIGTVILHGDNIVDGQQRLVTLTLLLNILGTTAELNLLNEDFNHNESKNNIKFNSNYINNYLKLFTPQKKANIERFVMNNCSMVVIKLSKLSEAFQLFDSQNARGKSLAPADLLKAFHLREMEDNTELEKKESVLKWEKAIDEGILNEVISKYLFRIRMWKDKKWKYFFTSSEIERFKGISILRTIKEGKIYPFVLASMERSMSNNFQIDEPIINGKRFFDYVEHYVQMYKVLLSFYNNSVKHDLSFKYQGSYRIGDRRLKYLYMNSLMCYYDKFGEDKEFLDFSKDLYRWVYSKRLEKSRIRYETILDLLKSDYKNPIRLIDSWYYPNIQSFRRNIISLNELRKEKPNKEIEECITNIEKVWLTIK